MNRYYNPVRTVQGPGCVARLPELLRELPGDRVLLLLWSQALAQKPPFSAMLAGEEGGRIQTLVFHGSNPTVEQLFHAYRETKAFRPNVVVAVGGGSTLDVGKSLCCLYGREIPDVDALRQIIGDKDCPTPSARWIGVPTTAGTGSETTCWATIWDPSRDAKRSVESRENYAWAALVDPALAAGMPLALAVSSALDAVAHAVESYWAKGTNAVSRALALEAVRTIMGSMDRLLAGEEGAHDAMARGSMLAGLAFSNTKTTACHSVSYPLTMRYGIPHGTAVSMLLAPVFRLNASCVEGVEDLLSALGVADAAGLDRRVRDILGRSGQAATLKAWGVEREALPRLAALGITQGRADNNPVPIGPAAILALLEQIYDNTCESDQKGV